MRSKIQPAFEQLLMPHVAKVDEAILPGLTSLSWTSLNIEKYLNRITTALGERLHFTADFHDHIRNIHYSKWPQVQYVDTQLYTCRTFNVSATANYWKLVLIMSLKQLPLFLWILCGNMPARICCHSETSISVDKGVPTYLQPRCVHETFVNVPCMIRY